MIGTTGAIDCDVHPDLPSVGRLLPYIDDYWREAFAVRGIDKLDLSLTGDPAGSPLHARPDWTQAGTAAPDVQALQRRLLDPFGLRCAVLNVLHAGAVMFSEDMGAVLCRAVNDWTAAEWLDRDTRLRGSILLPMQSPELAVAEIERHARDLRFVQVLVPVANELTLGRRAYWPVWRAAEAHSLPVAIHAGSAFRHAPTSVGWPSFFVEDYVSQSQAFEGALLSLLVEGVFQECPGLTVILAESGAGWLPSFMWRASKTWRGVRAEVPWMRDDPATTIRRHVRLTTQPLDVADDPARLARFADQLAAPDMLLFSTDFPHWHFDGTEALPRGLAPELASRIMRDNPLAAYPRLRAAVPSREGLAA